MSIKLATLFIFAVYITASLVRCDDEDEDWDEAEQWIAANNDFIVLKTARLAIERIRLRHSCSTDFEVISATHQYRAGEAQRYHIRILVRFDEGSLMDRHEVIEVVSHLRLQNNENNDVEILYVSIPRTCQSQCRRQSGI